MNTIPLKDRQRVVVNDLINQGYDFLCTEPNASPRSAPTIVLHLMETVVRVLWDGSVIDSTSRTSDYLRRSHWFWPEDES
jgi:hypothetical protein